MRLVLMLAIAAGCAGVGLPVAAAAGDAAKRMPCRPPLAFARAKEQTAPAGAETRAMLLLAVDRRVSGCRVLTPANARGGWVPEPSDQQGAARKRPAQGG